MFFRMYSNSRGLFTESHLYINYFVITFGKIRFSFTKIRISFGKIRFSFGKARILFGKM